VRYLEADGQPDRCHGHGSCAGAGGGVKVAELKAERDFLLFALMPSSPFGMSSSNMLLSAITGCEVDAFFRPRDEFDWTRAERTYEAAPEHLKPKLKVIMDDWRESDGA